MMQPYTNRSSANIMKIENMIKAMMKRKPMIAKDDIQIEINQHVTIKMSSWRGLTNEFLGADLKDNHNLCHKNVNLQKPRKWIETLVFKS